METRAGTSPVRVVVAEDHDAYREGIVRAIAGADSLELAGEATDGLEAERLIEELSPDVALLDVKMPGLGGLELCERVAERGLPTRVVMISAYLDPSLVARAKRAGAGAYIGKDAPREEICRALVRVGRGLVRARVH
jgi:two-component system, NarL family, nitrate/nitrite response regulator NarL